MIAIRAYYRAVAAGNIPAAVPVFDEGDDGLGTVVFAPLTAQVVNMALSSNPRDRAILAIQACQAARETLTANLPGISVP